MTRTNMAANKDNMAARREANSPDSLKLFISYSRKDAEIAEALVASLEARGFTVKIDTRDLPFGEAWQAELASFIQEADTVIWLVSRNSVSSHWCNWELAQVIRMQKRFVPVVIGEISVDEIPKAIGDIHLLPAGRVYDEEKDLDDLVTTLNTNRSWIKTHTRLTDRALEWSARGKAGEGLLRGRQLDDAIMWRDSEPPSAPHPGTDVLDLILQSQRATAQRQRFMVIGAGALAVVLMGLTVFSFIQQRAAVAAKTDAQQRSALLAAGSAEALLEDGQTDEALLLLLDAAGAFKPEAAPDRLLMAFDRALTQAMGEMTVRLPKGAKTFGLPSGIHVWFDGQLYRVTGDGLAPVLDIDKPVHLADSPFGNGLLAITEDQNVQGILPDGTVMTLGQFDMDVPDGWVAEYSVLPGGLAAMTIRDANDMPRTQLMELQGGQTAMLEGEYGGILDYALMPGGRRIVLDFEAWIEIDEGLSQTIIPVDTYDPEIMAQFEPYAALPDATVQEKTLYDAFVADDYAASGFDKECVKGPERMVCTTYQGVSSGVYRMDYLIADGGDTVTDLDELVTEIDRSDLKSGPGQNRSWIGFSPDGTKLAMVNNGELTVFSDEYGYYAPEDVRQWSHAHRIIGAQFVGNNRIAIATEVDPMVRVYTLTELAGYRERRPAQEERSELQGICDRIAKCLTTLGEDLEGALPPQQKGDLELTVSGDNFTVTRNGETILARTVEAEVMVGPDAVVGVFFHPTRDGIVAHHMNDPVVWFYPLDGGEREELYRAGKSVVSFDINEAGDLYAVIEYRVGGELDAILYSTEAQRQWRHLGSEYKWINAVFLDEDTVAIANGNAWSLLYDVPILTDVTTDAMALLSPDCQPEKAGDYATSPCWPL